MSLGYTQYCNFNYAHKTSKAFPVLKKLINDVQVSYSEFHPNRETANGNAKHPLSKIWLSLSWFSRNSRPFNVLLWQSPPTNYIQIGRKCRNYRQNFIHALSKAWLSLQLVSRDVQMPKGIARNYTELHFNVSTNMENWGRNSHAVT